MPGIDFNGMPVSPGDEMQAFVYWASGTTWETCLEDLTTGISGLMVTGEGWGVTTGGCASTFTEQGSTATLTYAGGTTAEWIVEDFDRNSTEVPFADFGTVSFGDLTTSLSSWSLTPDEQWGIVQGGSILAVPSAPSGDGFSVTYTGTGFGSSRPATQGSLESGYTERAGSNTSRSPAPWPCDSILDHPWRPGCDRPDQRNAWKSALSEESANAWPTECPRLAAFSRGRWAHRPRPRAARHTTRHPAGVLRHSLPPAEALPGLWHPTSRSSCRLLQREMQEARVSRSPNGAAPDHLEVAATAD